MFLRHNILPLFALFLLVLALPITVDLTHRAQDYFTHAAAKPANIVVNYNILQGPLPHPWVGMAQGGELESDNHTIVPIENTLSKIKSLGVKYIRLDHVLDRPDRINTINAIKKAGLTPFISLSYFSKTVADRDTGPVKNWREWERQIHDLIANVSKDTPDVYYEVWNEPDGKDFGDMSVSQYLELYRHTINAAETVGNVYNFKIGGPALSDPNNKKWLQEFLARIADDNLRLDFLSWHRYHRDPNVFIGDMDNYDEYLSQYPRFLNLPRIVSEWGTDPQPNVIHNSSYDTAHYLAVSRQFLDRIQLTAKFEIRDGFRNATDKNGLGIVDYNLVEKPSIMALKFLQKMTGDRVLLSGEGSYVTGFASKDDTNSYLLLVNFDPRSGYTEDVPIKINFSIGNWQIKKTVVDGANPYGREEDITIDLPNGEFSFTQPMLTNSAILWEMKKI